MRSRGLTGLHASAHCTGMSGSSAADRLRAGVVASDQHRAKMYLKLPLSGVAANAEVAAVLHQAIQPTPLWVAARSSQEGCHVMVVWGQGATSQPKARPLKATLLAQWLDLKSDQVRSVGSGHGGVALRPR